VFNNIYKATVGFFAGFVFLFAASMLVFCLVIIVYVAKTNKVVDQPLSGDAGPKMGVIKRMSIDSDIVVNVTKLWNCNYFFKWDICSDLLI